EAQRLVADQVLAQPLAGAGVTGLRVLDGAGDDGLPVVERHALDQGAVVRFLHGPAWPTGAAGVTLPEPDADLVPLLERPAPRLTLWLLGRHRPLPLRRFLRRLNDANQRRMSVCWLWWRGVSVFGLLWYGCVKPVAFLWQPPCIPVREGHSRAL